MNHSQRTILFWALIVAAPFVFFSNAVLIEPLLGNVWALIFSVPFPIVCIGGAFYIRAVGKNR